LGVTIWCGRHFAPRYSGGSSSNSRKGANGRTARPERQIKIDVEDFSVPNSTTDTAADDADAAEAGGGGGCGWSSDECGGGVAERLDMNAAAATVDSDGRRTDESSAPGPPVEDGEEEEEKEAPLQQISFADVAAAIGCSVEDAQMMVENGIVDPAEVVGAASASANGDGPDTTYFM
jgi:hypothetical protein